MEPNEFDFDNNELTEEFPELEDESVYHFDDELGFDVTFDDYRDY